jgi:long-chain acyl-CoA synthetase
MNDAKYRQVLSQPDRLLTARQRRWLRPRGFAERGVYALLYLINWVLVRILFRLRIEGCEHLPSSQPFVLAPNHASPFDPPILAASLPLGLLQQTYWAGKQSTVLRNRLRRVLSRLTRVIPIGDDAGALGAGLTVLNQQQNLVWFPEGKRSLNGHLQNFRPGIAFLLTGSAVPMVPVYIDGAYDAVPAGATIPRFRRKVVVRFGQPCTSEQLQLDTSTSENTECSVKTIRQCLLHLRDHLGDKQVG